MSPEWIPVLFISAMIFLLLFVLRPKGQSARFAIWRTGFIEAAYLSMAYLVLHVLQHPAAEALFGGAAFALLVGFLLPRRLFHKLAGDN